MSALPWFRAARRLVGLRKGQEWPYLEALMEAEAGQPTDDYRIASRVASFVCALVGAFTFRMVFLHQTTLFMIGAGISLAIGGALWFIFNQMDKSISPSRRHLRKQAKIVWSRYRGIKNLLGVEPAMSTTVGDVLNNAAGIYLRHSKPVRYFHREPESATAKSERAMEEAMARMFDLVMPETPAAQEVELSRGWAPSLLKEMRALDMAIERQKQSPTLSGSDPLINLREARMELEMREAATQELDTRS